MQFYHGVLPSVFRYLFSFRLVGQAFSYGEFLIYPKVIRRGSKKI